MKSKLILYVLTIIFWCVLGLKFKNSCSESACASIIIKCMLQKRCACNLKTECSCCEDCFKCIGVLLQECCPCLNICEKIMDSKEPNYKGSIVLNISGSPQLFDAFTEIPDEEKWKIFKYFDISTSKKYCTVIYLNQCISFDKCKRNCQSLGAHSCRWFYDGCCECVGFNCQNYGKNLSMCSECPINFDSSNFNYNEGLEDNLDDYY